MAAVSQEFSDMAASWRNENPYYEFLGAPSRSGYMTPYDKEKVTNFQLPELYLGENKFLGNTITNLIVQPVNWTVSEKCLPWMRTDQIHVTWDRWEFGTSIMEPVPHEGVPRSLSVSRTMGAASAVRRGKMLQVEGDFYATEAGRRKFTDQLTAMVQSVQITQNYDTIWALLTCKNNTTAWNHLYGRLPDSYICFVEDSISNYGCVQKDKDRIHILYENFKKLMLRNTGMGPTLMVIPQGGAVYMTMVHSKPGETVSSSYGATEFKEGPKAIATFRDGTEVFEAPDFNSDDQRSSSLLQRDVQIGERYHMIARDILSKSCRDYETRKRAIYVYDENLDKFVKIPFEKAVEYSCLFKRGSDQFDERLIKMINSLNSGAMSKRNNLKRRIDHGEDSDGEGEVGNKKTFVASDGTTEGAGNDSLFFMVTKDDDGKYVIPAYFGHMGTHAATHKFWERMGESMVGRMTGMCAKKTEDRDFDMSSAHSDLITLLNEIEKQPYVKEWFESVIEVNRPFSVDEAGNFVGEITPAYAAEEWGKTLIREWFPNSHGSLVLPQRTKQMEDAGLDYPSGFANWPGLLTLASEASKENSTWRIIGQRASRGVRYIQSLVDYFVGLAPNSEVLAQKNQSPWFHKRDPAGAFFEQVISIRRDPIFLPHLPSSDPGNKGGIATETEKPGEREEIVYHPIGPVPEAVDLKGLKEFLGGDIRLRDSKTRVTGKSKGLEEGTGVYVFTDPRTGITLSIPSVAIKRAAILPKIVIAASYLGDLSVQSFIDIIEALRKTMSTETLDAEARLIDFVINNAPARSTSKSKSKALEATIYKVRTIVLGLWTKYSSDTNGLIRAIRTLCLLPEERNDNTKVAQAKKELSAIQKVYAYDPAADKDVVNASDISGEKDVYPEVGPMDTTGLSAAFDDLLNVISTNNQKAKSGDVAYGQISFIGFGKDGFVTTSSPVPPPSTTATTTTPKTPTIHATVTAALKKVNDLLATTKIADAIIAASKSKPEALTEGLGLFGVSKRRLANVTGSNVATDAVSVAGAAWRRSPLTMSLALLESMSRESIPLIRPGDPTQNHLVPYSHSTDGGAFLPKDVWKRPEYSTIDALDKSRHGVDHTSLNFISKHIEYIVEGSESIGSKSLGAPRKRVKTSATKKKSSKTMKMMMDSDSEDDGDSDYGVDESIGAHALDDTDYGEGKWDKGNLYAKTYKRGDTPQKRIPFKGSSQFKRVNSELFRHWYNTATKISDPILRSAVIVALTTPFTPTSWRQFMKKDVLVPVNITLWKTGITHSMESFILMKGGRSTGCNLFSHSNFSLGYDAMMKVIIGNLTFYSKALVTETKSVHTMHNVMYRKYKGGNNTRFVTKPSDLNATGIDRPSIVSTAGSIRENDFPRVMSILGPLPVGYINSAIDGENVATYGSYDYYNTHVYKFSRLDKTPTTGDDGFFEEDGRCNYVAFQGHQFNFNAADGYYSEYTTCQGHRGLNGCGSGSAEVTNGGQKYFPVQNWGAYRLQ
jgi:hypothetical protein